MDTKHTQGEWIITEAETGVTWYRIEADENIVCDIELYHKKAGEPSEDAEEALANAKLIAAAPEMLRMLNACRILFNKDGFKETSKEIGVLIKKATE